VASFTAIPAINEIVLNTQSSIVKMKLLRFCPCRVTWHKPDAKPESADAPSTGRMPHMKLFSFSSLSVLPEPSVESITAAEKSMASARHCTSDCLLPIKR
jgi:hypothetical protein